MIETGETFLNDAQLLRFIQEKCGDDIARFIEKKLGSAIIPQSVAILLEKAFDFLNGIDISEIENDIDSALELIRKAAGEGGKSEWK